MGYKKKKSTKNVKKAPSKDVEGDIPDPEVVRFDHEDFKHLRLYPRKKTPEPMNTCETPGTSSDALKTRETLKLGETPHPSGTAVPCDGSKPGETSRASSGLSKAKSKLSEVPQPSAASKSSSTSKPNETQKAKETPPRAAVPIPCYACVLWCPKIKEDMDEHKKVGNQLFSTLGIGKMISDKVFQENPNMDWKKPFLLLDVNYREDITALKDTDGSYIIPVVEKDAVDNLNKPAAEWILHVSGQFSQFSQEILRCPPTTVMIWGARSCPAEGLDSDQTDQSQQPKSQGDIYIDSDCCGVNIIIFHAEVISNERIRDMKGDFGKAELGAFKEAYRRRICHSFIDGGTVAVHFSKYHDAKYNSVTGKKEIIPIPRPE